MDLLSSVRCRIGWFVAAGDDLQFLHVDVREDTSHVRSPQCDVSKPALILLLSVSCTFAVLLTHR